MAYGIRLKWLRLRLLICAASLSWVIPALAVNSPPVAVEDHATVNGTGPVAIAVLSNDTDPEGQALTVTSLTAPSKGTAVIQGNQVIYTPGPEYSGFDYFFYTVRDSANATSVALVSTHPPYSPNTTDKYYQWAATKFGADLVANPARESSVWGGSSDPDTDGRPNLVEYALGSNPATPDVALQPILETPNAQNTGAYRWDISPRVDDASLAVIPQVSCDLVSWSPPVPPNASLWTGDKYVFVKGHLDIPVGGFQRTIYHHDLTTA